MKTMIAIPLLTIFCALLPGSASAGASADGAISMERRIIVAGGEQGGAVAAYAIFANAGEDAEIVEAKCDCADNFELHRVNPDPAGGGMNVDWPLTLPAGSRTAISPPGLPRHMMAVGLKAPIAPGDKLTIRFRLASGEWVSGVFDAVESSAAAWRAFDQAEQDARSGE